MRYFFSKQNIDPTNKMKKYIDLEINKKIFDIKTFLNFRDNCNKICSELFEFILNKKNEGKSIAGYGATAKSATTLNFSKINNKMLDCIYDSTPFKIGKYTPGTYRNKEMQIYFQMIILILQYYLHGTIEVK